MHRQSENKNDMDSEKEEFKNNNEVPIVYLTQRGLSPELIARMGKHKTKHVVVADSAKHKVLDGHLRDSSFLTQILLSSSQLSKDSELGAPCS